MEVERTTVRHPAKPKPSIDLVICAIVGVVALMIGGGIGFFGGIQFGRLQTNNVTATGAPGRGFNGAARTGGIGTVTAVTNTSITITPRARRGVNAADKTYTITSATVVTSSGASSTASAITVGDTVRIQTDPSDATTATTIDINPTAPSAGNGSNANGTTAPTMND